MPVETEVIPFLVWLPKALLQFGIAIGVLLILGTLFSYVAAAVRLGPAEAFYLVARILLDAIPDFLKTSPRRVMALARLAVQEAVRRKVLVVFVVFVTILLFAGWFLGTDKEDPAKLYINFVLTVTNYLMLLLGFTLSAFSLPADFKTRTMYTITTKPVRMGEIVIGRFLGFAAVGSVLIVGMCAVSYVFVTRGLAHTHQLDGALVPIESSERGGAPLGEEGETSLDQYHRHKITINAEGIGRTDSQMAHWHEVRKVGDKVEIGPAEGMFGARVPHYGTLLFRNRAGAITERGISVGIEWEYRSYIEGQSAMRAIWTFDGVTPAEYPEGLPVAMTISVYRSHKGDIDRGITASLRVVNPDPAAKIKRSAEIPFIVQEFVPRGFERHLPRKLPADDGSGREIDLFDDLVYDGQVQLEMRCTDGGQYLGMAPRDLFLHSADQPFAANFVKGYYDLWLQMMIAIAFGVMFSTFLHGPVAMLAALSSMVVGFVGEFIFDLALGKQEGGGPVESMYRIVTQRNPLAELELGLGEPVIRFIDTFLLQVLRAMANLLPNFSWFNSVPYVAYGMNISMDAVLEHSLLAAAYAVVALVVGYFFLKTREIAAD
jgi:ABC-type transport system involved in multi-copper enzyme maturation permease subunit